MTNIQRLVLVLAFIFAVLVGVLLATTLLSGGPSATPAPSSSAQAQASASPSTGTSANPSGSDASGDVPSATAPGDSASPSASASASPSPSPTPVPKATVTVTQLKLDAATDTAGSTRVITWIAGGDGKVSATLTSLASDGAVAKMCLSANGKALGCYSGTGGTLPATTRGVGVHFKLTLRGVAAATPLVAVKISFPAVHPAVVITNARFDGTAYPDTNGIQVVVQPRADGKVKLVADWGGHPFQYEIDLIEQGGTGLQSLPNQGPATKVTQSLTVTKASAWMVVLQNIEAGFGVTPLTATISWP